MIQPLHNTRRSPHKPVVYSKYKKAFDKLWCRLEGAQLRFLNSVFSRRNNIQAASDLRRQQVARRLDDVNYVIRCCEAFISKLDRAKLSDRDEREKERMSTFLVQRATSFVEFWREKLVAIEHGAPLDVEPKNISLWFDEIIIVD